MWGAHYGVRPEKRSHEKDKLHETLDEVSNLWSVCKKQRSLP